MPGLLIQVIPRPVDQVQIPLCAAAGQGKRQQPARPGKILGSLGGDGSQPLLSLSQGSKDQESLKTYAKWTFMLGIGFGITGAAIFLLVRGLIPTFYGTSPEAAAYILHAAPAFALVMALYGLTKPAVSYFYATHRVLRSNLLVYGEIVLTLIFIFILPLFLGLDGVWYTIPAVQISLGILCIFFLKKQD